MFEVAVLNMAGVELLLDIAEPDANLDFHLTSNAVYHQHHLLHLLI
jgi:hypothetical protein